MWGQNICFSTYCTIVHFRYFKYSVLQERKKKTLLFFAEKPCYVNFRKNIFSIYVYSFLQTDSTCACMYGKVRRFHWDCKSNTIKCVEAIVWIRRLLLYKKRREIAKFQWCILYNFASVAILIFSFCTAPLCGQFLHCIRSRQVVISTRLCPGSGSEGPGDPHKEGGVRGWEFLPAMAGSSFRSLWEIGWTGAILRVPTRK